MAAKKKPCITINKVTNVDKRKFKSSSKVAQKPVRSNLCLVRQSAKCRNIFWPTYLSPNMLLRHVVTSFLVLIVPMDNWT